MGRGLPLNACYLQELQWSLYEYYEVCVEGTQVKMEVSYVKNDLSIQFDTSRGSNFQLYLV